MQASILFKLELRDVVSVEGGTLEKKNKVRTNDKLNPQMASSWNQPTPCVGER